MLIKKLFYKYKYSLRKSKHAFQHIRDLLIRKKNKISQDTYELIKKHLLELEHAIEKKDSYLAYSCAQEVAKQAKIHLHKNIFDYFNEWVLGLGFVLLTITIINQLWFQHYQIPSGSMRPTLLEKDRVIATKTCYGINFPFKQSHIYFNPDHLKRGNLAIFTVDNMPAEENKSKYLFIFSTKKQMVKRLIGKPGDLLYFYGGKVYGLDSNLSPITDFQNLDAFKKLEHVPISNFEGKVVTELDEKHNKQLSSPVYLHQMGQTVAKLYSNSQGNLQGKFSNGRQWVDESPKLEYKDLWGIKNFAMSRILTRMQALEMGFDLKGSLENYFLELHHSPHTNYPRPHLGVDIMGRLRPMITPEKSLIALTPAHMQKIKNALYSARFEVKGGYAGNYSLLNSFKPHQYSPLFPQVPDGTYEFINGIAYQVNSLGVQHPLAQDHPLNSTDPKMIQRLYNLGMQMISLYEPSSLHLDFVPSRFVYFRDGALYAMNHEIFAPNDPILEEFVSNEKSKAHGFIDHGNPILADGTLNKELIINYGLRIPKGEYLFLGDNHAGSRDCRDFGFIPEKNIQGSPAFIIWPSSSRLGLLKQGSLHWFNLPNVLVCMCALLAFSASTLYSRKLRKKEL